MSYNTLMKAADIREAVAKTVRLLAKDSIRVTQQGANAYCKFDKKTGKPIQINLPVIPEKPSAEFMSALQGFLDHEVAHALFTTISNDPSTKVSAESKKLAIMTNIVEDCRIEIVMSQKFPGAAVNLGAVRDYVIKETWGKETDAIMSNTSLSEEKRLAELVSVNLVPFMRARANHRECLNYMKDRNLFPIFEKIDREIPDLENRLAKLKDTKGSEKLARLVLDALKPKKLPEMPPMTGDSEKGDDAEPEDDKKEKSESEGSSKKDDAEKPEKKDKPEKKKKPKPETSDEADAEKSEEEKSDEGEATKEPSDDEGESGEADAEDFDDGDLADGDFGDGDMRGGGTVTEDTAPESTFPEYDEIDFDKVRDTDEILSEKLAEMLDGAFSGKRQVDFTKDYDIIEPYRVPADHTVDCAAIEERVRQSTGPLQNELQRLMVARTQSFFVPGFKSGRLNGAALHRIKTGDDRLFRRKHVHETKEVAVELLLDLSGSMAGHKINVAVDAAWGCAHVLDTLKITNEVIGFSSLPLYAFRDVNCDYGKEREDRSLADNYLGDLDDFVRQTGLSRNCVRQWNTWMPIFKSFEERFSPLAKKRLAHIAKYKTRMMHNNDAVAVEYAGVRLLRRKEPRKILIVLSDGQPCDEAVASGMIGATLKDNIQKLERAGVETVGIGICDDAVKRFYKNNIVINNVADLPGQLTRVLKKALLV